MTVFQYGHNQLVGINKSVKDNDKDYSNMMKCRKTKSSSYMEKKWRNYIKYGCTSTHTSHGAIWLFDIWTRLKKIRLWSFFSQLDNIFSSEILLWLLSRRLFCFVGVLQSLEEHAINICANVKINFW